MVELENPPIYGRVESQTLLAVNAMYVAGLGPLETFFPSRMSPELEEQSMSISNGKRWNSSVMLSALNG